MRTTRSSLLTRASCLTVGFAAALAFSVRRANAVPVQTDPTCAASDGGADVASASERLGAVISRAYAGDASGLSQVRAGESGLSGVQLLDYRVGIIARIKVSPP